MNSSSLFKSVAAIAAAAGFIAIGGMATALSGPLAGAVAHGIAVTALGLAFYWLRTLARGMDEVASVCAASAHGNLEARVLSARDGGALGRVQKSVNDMLDIVDAYVRESAASMEYVSRGKTFRKVLVRGLPGSFRNGAVVINAGTDAMDKRVRELARMAQDFGASMEAVAKTLTGAASDLESDSGSMTSAADNTSRQSTAVAAASEQASTNVQTVATAAEELSASIAEISRQVARSTESTQRAVANARETNTRIQSLAEAAQKIGEVVKLINDIAGQTNLLALNATIEAARAGDAGKGFAVVASEVKSLATQTAKATEEIGSKVAEMQAATAQSVDAVRAIGETISEINEVCTTIAAAVEEQGAATKEIARNVQQASAGTTEVSANVAGISQAAASTGDVAVRVRTTSQKIGGEVGTLRSQVQTFLATVNG